jgi:hypothetical protein
VSINQHTKVIDAFDLLRQGGLGVPELYTFTLNHVTQDNYDEKPRADY